MRLTAEQTPKVLMCKADLHYDKTVSGTMTISTYQIDNILKAYSRQSKVSSAPASSAEGPKTGPRYADVVSLGADQQKPEVFDKISYSLMDVLLKGNKSK